MPSPPNNSAAREALTGTGQVRVPEGSRFPEERTGVSKVAPRDGGGTGSEAQNELSVGQTLSGRFVIERQLAAGAMGSVYLARHNRLGRRVAIKVMAPHMAGDHRIVERFEREAEVMSALHHPNIVEILDYNRMEDGTPYLVMEYVEGPTLEDYLAKQGPLDVRTALALSRQVGEALVSAHQLEIVHRDLKPANVLVQGTTEGPFVKLLDFGIAKRAAKDAAMRRGSGRALTGEFEVMGTPAYMAPEQAAGKAAELDARGDQYSLAVLLFEMLTGAPPFDSDDVMDLLVRIINDPPVAPSQLVAGVTPNVDRVVLRALSKRPEQRYPSIRAMLSALVESEARHSLPPSLSRAALLEGSSDKHESPTLPPGGTPALRRAPSLPPEFYKSNQRAAPTNPSQLVDRETGKPHSPQRTASLQRTAPQRSRTTAKDVRQLARQRVPQVNHADVHAELDKARGECLLGNATLALCYLRSVVEQSLTVDRGSLPQEETAGWDRTLGEAVELLKKVVELRIGSPDRAVRSTVDPADLGSLAGLTRDEVYVLTRVEGRTTLEELVDLSPFAEAQTWAAIAQLTSTGMIVPD